MRTGSEETVGTVVGSSVTLQGVLKDSSDIIVHGRVDGEINSEKSVIISEGAYIKGPVTAEVVVVTGSVKGSIEARVKLTIHTGGQVDGSIVTPELVIESGARFNGKCTMGNLEKNENSTPEGEVDIETKEEDVAKADNEVEYELE